MTMPIIIIPAAIEGLTTRKDRTMRLTLGTNELSPDKAAGLFALQNTFCYVAIKPEDFGHDEIEALEAHEAELTDDPRKSFSKRLRAVLYRVWEVDNDGFTTFEAYYFAKMERMIEHWKKKIG